ncbi:MAG: glycosyltransferase family 9 protein [Chitinispirillaceae bacterium]|nr:glycosyltransferase family 9 protein [Chitinispirillaceae bacterium]
MKILVLRLSSMGDCILAAAVFSYIKNKYADASISFITGSEYQGLFSDDPRLSTVAGIDDRTARLPENLAAHEWDLVVDLQNNGRSRRVLAGIRTKSPVGRFDKQHWQRFMLLFFRMNFYDPSLHVAARYIEAAGGDPRHEEIPAPALFFSEERCARARTVFPGAEKRRRCALFPFSAWKNKEWPAERFEAVGRHFLAAGWNIVIFGGSQDAPAAEAMRCRIGGRCVSLAGALSLYECGCLMKSFDLALGNDTGLSHLARACGVRTGILFGPTTHHFGFFPYGSPPYRIFEEQCACRPCHAHGGSVCPMLFHQCIKKISAARVIAGLEELFMATAGKT